MSATPRSTSLTWQSDADAAILSRMLAVFDHKPEWRQSALSQRSLIVRGFRRQYTGEEVDMLNTYGVKGAEFILDAASFGTEVPVKLDQLVVTIGATTEYYTIDKVGHIPGFSNSLLLYRCACYGA